MLNSKKVCCPSSEDFFYWPPEEMADYHHWCKASSSGPQKVNKSTRVDDDIKVLHTKKMGLLIAKA